MAKSRRVAPAPFLTKTHKMIEDCKTNDVISWGENGDSFIVWKPIEFANDLLPIHFKHDRFSSFIRQLNTYGFRKVVPDKWEFANENFKRGEYDLLREIQRRKTQLPSITHTVSPSILSPTTPSLLPLVRSHDDLPCSSSTSTIRDLSQLSNENAELRQEKHTLTTEIAQTKQICEGLLDSLSRFVDVKQLDLRFLMKDDPMKDLEDMMNQRGATPETYEAKEKDENSVVLFGVVMKACIQNQHKEDRKRKRRDLCGVSDRSKKLAQPAI